MERQERGERDEKFRMPGSCDQIYHAMREAMESERRSRFIESEGSWNQKFLDSLSPHLIAHLISGFRKY